MLTTAILEKTLSLLDEGYTFPSITEETAITTEDAEAVHVAWFNGTPEQVSREILHVYPAHVTKALAMALLSGKF